jgi:CRP-like cAMP-binding protein
MVGGAVLASALVNATSLEGSFWILGAGALIVAVSCVLGLRGLDEASHRRTEELASRLDVVEGLPVTAGVPQLVLERLASASELRPLSPGTDVVVQGEPADALYAVVSGQVVVHQDGVVRVHLGPGDSFGERGLLDNAPRNATVTTEMETLVLWIDGDVLLEALEAAPTLGPALNRSSTARGVLVPSD